MEATKKESRYVKAKIVAGYLLLGVASILSVGYVYRAVVRFSTPDGSYALLHTKRNAVSQTLYHLYQAESYGQLMIAGYPSYDARYKRELRIVRTMIDSLRSLAAPGDSLQTMRLDSIVRLIGDKERRTMSLRHSIRSGGTASLLDKNIRLLLDAPDTLPVPDTLTAGKVVREEADTLAVPRRKRRFFRRLADVFSPPKTDSSVVISRREVVDAVSPAAVKDTIATVLRALQDSVTSDRAGIYDRAWREGLRLRYNNELVNTKIYRLILDFEAEDTAYLMQRIERNEVLRRRTSRILGAIAVAAVLGVLLFVAVLWRDINRSNRYRRALERANRDNEALLAAREKLMLAITHDIKAPLGSVMGYIDLLARLCGGKRETLYLHRMKESSEHLLALVDSLLDFYRLDINKVEVRRVAFVPGQLFETVCAEFAAQAASKGIELTLQIEPAARCEVAGDAFRIRQIAENLLSNAVKFTDAGLVTLRADRIDGRLVFSVRDTGRGISREEKERIFGEFVRLRSAQGVDGFGLGLSIVDRLVKLLGGTISLESRPGEGSKFIVSVPVDAAAAAEPAPRPQREVRVLLVDDDPLQLQMTAAMCAAAGIRTESCAYPEYAARLVAESRFDAVLTDIQMPSSDGFGVLAAVHDVDSSLPVVAVSARGDLSAADFAARGFAGCLRKPFTQGELLAVVDAATAGAGSVAADGAHTLPESAPGRVPTDGTPDTERQDAAPEPAGHLSGAAVQAGRSDASGPVPGSAEAETGTMERAADNAGDGPHVSGTARTFDTPDFAALTAFAGDDRDAAERILRSFAEQTLANCDALEKALGACDAAALRAVAHKMLPIFRMLRADAVVAVLRRAETAEAPLPDGLRSEVRTASENIRGIVREAQKLVSL